VTIVVCMNDLLILRNKLSIQEDFRAIYVFFLRLTCHIDKRFHLKLFLGFLSNLRVKSHYKNFKGQYFLRVWHIGFIFYYYLTLASTFKIKIFFKLFWDINMSDVIASKILFSIDIVISDFIFTLDYSKI